jgi:hypothetical protein
LLQVHWGRKHIFVGILFQEWNGVLDKAEKERPMSITGICPKLAVADFSTRVYDKNNTHESVASKHIITLKNYERDILDYSSAPVNVADFPFELLGVKINFHPLPVRRSGRARRAPAPKDLS